jgi:hypothetical protein
MNETFTIELNGSTTQFKKSRKCNLTQLARIENLAKFVFENPSLLAVLNDVFLYCRNQQTFSKEQFQRRMNLSKKFYDLRLFKAFSKKLEDFYISSKEIDNDRGRVQECLCRLAIEKKYISEKGVEIIFGCKVSVRLENESFTTDPHDVDVVGRVGVDRGHYLESKRGIEVRLDKQATRKMAKLSKLSEFLDKLNREHGVNHIFFIFVLTNEEDHSKISCYESNWPILNVIGINSFAKEFCQN